VRLKPHVHPGEAGTREEKGGQEPEIPEPHAPVPGDQPEEDEGEGRDGSLA
jgi:hypothetical protein